MTDAAVLDRPAVAIAEAQGVCAHCGSAAPRGNRFCCAGCAAAYDTIQRLGFGRYYRQRLLDPAVRAPRPEPAAARHDLGRHVAVQPDGTCALMLAVDGLQCGACVWLIESVLARDAAVVNGRVNLTTRRLRLVWRGGADEAARLVGAVEALGYRLVPFDAGALATAADRTARKLVRALGIAGFAAGNVMLLSIGEWAGLMQDMGPATRDLLHWVTALLALPAIALAGQPFFASAVAALRHGRTNMDVPISLGVVLVAGISLADTIADGTHTYYESALMLLFFLLVGRLLDHRARGRAREAAEQLLLLRTSDVTVQQADGRSVRRPPEQVAPGDRVLVAMGERIGVDGVVETGESPLDSSLVTGESLPTAARPGTRVFAGMLNLGGPLSVRATATGAGTVLAECVRLIEAAEARRGRFVVLADRVARAYVPAVHAAAFGTFVGWLVFGGATISQALLIASAVLIVTCPCALALAVPAVQVIASSRLFSAGILLKSPTALERLAQVDTVVFDKTGTLTEPLLVLEHATETPPEALRLAAGIAAASRHPLARALVAASGPTVATEGVTEHAGAGLSCPAPGGELRLGSRPFCGLPAAATAGPELWLTRPGTPPVQFRFVERPRADAAPVLATLRAMGLAVQVLSGDRAEPVARLATELGIAEWQAAQSPVDKVATLTALAAAGKHVLMVGDGLNDGPALAAAWVSASPATAADISQTMADFVFQGSKLRPVVLALTTARQARNVIRQNLVLSLGYNALTVPLAIAGLVMPWLAAAAMSASSLLVISNSLRLHRAGAGR